METTEALPRPIDFDEEVRLRNLRGARIAAGIAALLMPTGIVMEYLSVPEDIWDFFAARVATAFVCLALWAWTYTRCGRDRGSMVLFLVGAACCLGFEYMVIRLGGFSSGYYVGVIQVMLGVSVLATWELYRSAVACVTLVSIWLIPALVQGPQQDPAVFMMHLYAILICAVIAVVSSGMRYNALLGDNHARVALAHTSEQLGVALRKKSELSEARMRFFQNVSHELRTPLTMILAPIPRMRKRVTDARTLKDVSSIGRNADRLLRHIDELLDIAKLDSGALRLSIDEVAIEDIAARVVQASEPGAESKGLELSLDARQPIPAVHVDAYRVETILANLVSNAIKYTPPGGTVIVVVEQVEENVHVSVTDTGRGIPADELSHVFDRFYQAKGNPTRSAGGVGIGLALAKELAELHGGAIEVESDVGVGSTFTLSLPMGTSHLSDDTLERRQVVDPSRNRGRRWTDRPTALPSWRPERRSSAAPANRSDIPEGARILVVEDEPDICDFIVQLLKREGYRVHSVGNGRDAFEWAQQHQPDLVISDVMMPKMTGLELTRAIRENHSLASVPILLLTARSGTETTIEAYEQGANDFISKPFDPGVLLARVRAQLRAQHLQLQLINQEKFASVGLLAAGIAHEVRNPLNAVINAGRVLQERGAGAANAEKLLDVVVDGAKRIDMVVGALNAHARPSARERIQVFSLREGIEATLQLLQHRMKKIEVDFQAVGRADVSGKPGQVNQVFLNLIDNAIRSGAKKMTISIVEQDARVRVLVADDGPGVPAEVANRIFEPFFSTRDEGGTGLGLNLSRRIVEDVGGRLTLVNPGERGAQFVVEFPTCESLHEASA